MTALEKYIKGLNLCFTDTIEADEYYLRGDQIYELMVDYSNALPVSRYIELFNGLYVKFRKDLECLEQLDVGDNIEVKSFFDKVVDGKRKRKVAFSIENSRISQKNNTVLYFEECESKYSAYTKNIRTTKTFGCLSNDRENINLSEDLIKSYIDFVQKHHFFITLFYELRKKKFGSLELGNLWCDIDYGKVTLFDELNHFNFYACNKDAIFSFAKISFKLGEELHIDYDESKIHMIDIDDEKDTIKQISNQLYLNASYVRNRKRTN